MKEQDRTSENNKKMEISNLPDAEFKTQITRLLNKFRGKVDDLRENFNNEKGNIKLEIEKKRTIQK